MGRPQTLTYNNSCSRTSYHTCNSRTNSRSICSQVLLRWSLLCHMAEGFQRAANIDNTLSRWLRQTTLKYHPKSVIYLSTLRSHYGLLIWSHIRSHAHILYLCCWRKRWTKLPRKTCRRGHRWCNNRLMRTNSFTP